MWHKKGRNSIRLKGMETIPDGGGHMREGYATSCREAQIGERECYYMISIMNKTCCGKWGKEVELCKQILRTKKENLVMKMAGGGNLRKLVVEWWVLRKVTGALWTN